MLSSTSLLQLAKLKQTSGDIIEHPWDARGHFKAECEQS
jgi:hypothetical protein